MRNKRKGGIVKIVDNNGINDIIKEKHQIDINLSEVIVKQALV